MMTEPDVRIAKSHWQRRKVNAHLTSQDKECVLAESVGNIKGAVRQPQDMWLKPRTVLVGRCCAGTTRPLCGLE